MTGALLLATQPYAEPLDNEARQLFIDAMASSHTHRQAVRAAAHNLSSLTAHVSSDDVSKVRLYLNSLERLAGTAPMVERAATYLALRYSPTDPFLAAEQMWRLRIEQLAARLSYEYPPS